MQQENLRPPPKLTVSEWADKNRRLDSKTSAEPGQWYTDRAPYQRELMDVVTDRYTQTIVFKKSAQVGFTEILINVMGYFIDQEPDPILMVLPTVDLARDFSKDRLAPAIQASDALRDKVAEQKSKSGDNTMLNKSYPGGQLTLAGANSPNSLSSRPKRVVLFDEVDKYPKEVKEFGDPISLGRKRTQTYQDRKKVIIGSTPSIKGASVVDSAFQQSDQRFYNVPCPHCGELSKLEFKDIDFSEAGTVDDPVWICKHCGGMATERDKMAMLREGKWIAEAEFEGTAGFSINEFYSPWSTWSEIVKDFLAKKDDRHKLKQWTNEVLGETWEDGGESADPESLAARAELYEAEVPAGAVVLTAGVDVQADRFEIYIWGWAEGYERWFIHREVIIADTSLISEWSSRLDPYLTTEAKFQHQSGSEMGISSACVDSGYRTQQAYAYCAKRFGRRFYAIKGVDGAGRPEVSEMAKPRIPGPKPPKMFALGVDTLKGRNYDDLQNTEPGPNYCHFPTDSESADKAFYSGLTAEKRVTKYVRGFRRQVWEKTQPRNEPWDCLQYAMAAVILLRPAWKTLTLRVSPDAQLPDPETAVEEPVANTKKDPRRSTARRRPKNFATSWKR